MNPGRLFTSFRRISPLSRSRKKSTRAIPALPAPGRPPGRAAGSGRSAPPRPVRGDHQLGGFVHVLRFVIVELGLGNDLAGHRCLGLLVAQHRDLDLPSVHRALHQDLGVVSSGLIEAASQLLAAAHLGDSHRGAEAGRLDEGREPDLSQDPLDRGGVTGAELRSADQDSRYHREAGGRQQPLGHLLVHLDGGAQHTGAHVGDSGHLEKALERAILAAGAVDDGKDHVELGGGRAVADGDQGALPPESPAG